jgi:hypothetical protein
MIPTKAMLLLVALPSIASAGAPSPLSPVEPRVNGLLAADRVHTSFNVGEHSAEGLTLSWKVTSPGLAKKLGKLLIV